MFCLWRRSLVLLSLILQIYQTGEMGSHLSKDEVLVNTNNSVHKLYRFFPLKHKCNGLGTRTAKLVMSIFLKNENG